MNNINYFYSQFSWIHGIFQVATTLNPFLFQLSISVKRWIKMINIIRFQVLFIVLLSLLCWYRGRVLSQEGMSILLNISMASAGTLNALLSRDAECEGFYAWTGDGSAGDTGAGYAARNVRASWRLKPSLGMYSACPGTARILSYTSRRQPRAAHAVGRIPSRRQCPPSWLSDNWILSIKPATNVNRERNSGWFPTDLLSQS